MKSCGDLHNSISKYGVDGNSHMHFFARSYHRFFENYAEVSVPKKSGKGTTIKRIYIGNYYSQKLSRSQKILLRVLYITLFICAVILFVFGATENITANKTWYVALAQTLNIPFLFYILIAYISYFGAPNKMTVYDYKCSSRSLIKATIGASVTLALIVVAMVLFMIINPSEQWLTELFCIIKYFLSDILILTIYIIEKRIQYIVIPNRNTIPDNAVKIN